MNSRSLKSFLQTWRVPFTCALLVIATLIVYWQIRDFEFVNLDEPTMLLQNPFVTSGLTLHNIMWGLTTSYFEYWHPITWWSHMLDFELFGADAGPQHCVSLGFHIINTLILFAVFREMTGMLLRSAMVAALFALHPMHVESVVWLAERKDVLSTFFWLASIWSYARYCREQEKKTPHTELFFRLSLLCFLGGIMSKPMVVTLPCVLLLLDFWPLRRFSFLGVQFSDLKQRPIKTCRALGWDKLIVEKLPYFGLALISCAITFHNVKSGGNIASEKMLPLSVRLENVPVSYARYLAKLVWPADMVAYYPMPDFWPMGEVLAALVVLILLSAVAVKYAARAPYLLFGWCLFLGTTFPTISLVPVGMQSIADRYTYMPYIGLFISAVWTLADGSKHWPQRFALLGSLSVATVIACGVLSWHQVGFWRNSLALWPHCLASTTNNIMAEYNYGVALQAAGHPHEAMEYYQQTLRLNPKHVLALLAAGQLSGNAGDLTEATNYFSRAAKVQPDAAMVQDNLGIALFQAGDFSGAVAHCGEAIRLEPRDYHAMLFLARALSGQGRSDEAIQMFRQDLQFVPKSADAHYYLGLELLKRREFDQAISELGEALRLNPSLSDAQIQLDTALRQAAASGTHP